MLSISVELSPLVVTSSSGSIIYILEITL